MIRKKERTLYTCLSDVAEYFPADEQRKVTRRLLTYLADTGRPLLFLGTDWAGNKELEKMKEIMRKMKLKEGSDYGSLPINMTMYLGEIGENDIERRMRYDAGEEPENGEYRLITTHETALRKAQRRLGDKVGKTILVEDWGNSYMSIFGFYKWVGDAIEDELLNTDTIATLIIRDSRYASQYAIARVENEDKIKYKDTFDIMAKRAPKLLNYLEKNRITPLIEEKPNKDLAVDLEELMNSKATREVLEPSVRETIEFIGRMAKTR